MRNLLVFIFTTIALLNLFCTSKEKVKEKMLPDFDYFVEIYTNNFSLAQSKLYKINKTQIVLSLLSGVKGEPDKILLTKDLSKYQQETIINFLKTFPLDSLKNEYKNVCVTDGDQKTIIIMVNGKKHQINLSNYYQPDIGNLINLVNSFLDLENRIKYPKKELLELMEKCK